MRDKMVDFPKLGHNYSHSFKINNYVVKAHVWHMKLSNGLLQ